MWCLEFRYSILQDSFQPVSLVKNLKPSCFARKNGQGNNVSTTSLDLRGVEEHDKGNANGRWRGKIVDKGCYFKAE